MNTNLIIPIAIVGAVVATFFLGKHTGKEKAEDELLPQIEHLTSQVSQRDTLIVGYRGQIDDCLTGLIATRDSLTTEIETLIRNRPPRRPYSAPNIPVSNNDELLSRAAEWLDNPQ